MKVCWKGEIRMSFNPTLNLQKVIRSKYCGGWWERTFFYNEAPGLLGETMPGAAACVRQIWKLMFCSAICKGSPRASVSCRIQEQRGAQIVQRHFDYSHTVRRNLCISFSIRYNGPDRQDVLNHSVRFWHLVTSYCDNACLGRSDGKGESLALNVTRAT